MPEENLIDETPMTEGQKKMMSEIVEGIAQRTEAVDVIPEDKPEAEADLHKPLSHEMAGKIMDAAVKNKSELDPDGNIMFRTLAELAKEKLPPVRRDWENLAQLAYFEIRNAHKKGDSPRQIKEMRLPLRADEPMFTKKNRVRLVPGDNSSPIGPIHRGNWLLENANKPYATVAINAVELFKYAVSQLGDRPSWLPETEKLSEAE